MLKIRSEHCHGHKGRGCSLHDCEADPSHAGYKLNTRNRLRSIHTKPLGHKNSHILRAASPINKHNLYIQDNFYSPNCIIHFVLICVFRFLTQWHLLVCVMCTCYFIEHCGEASLVEKLCFLFSNFFYLMCLQAGWVDQCSSLPPQRWLRSTVSIMSWSTPRALASACGSLIPWRWPQRTRWGLCHPITPCPCNQLWCRCLRGS